MFKPIEWSEELSPNESYRYNHVIGTSPLGKFVITWKSWKDTSGFYVEETPFQGGHYICEYSLDEAKSRCQQLYTQTLISALSLKTVTENLSREGKLVKHISGGDVYRVTDDYGSRLTAVRTVDITNLAEWQFL
jgi:hypothetical protein